MSDLLTRVDEAVEEITDHAYEIEFLDHSAMAEEDDWLTIRDLYNPEFAQNNCHAASCEVLEQVNFHSFINFDTSEIVVVDEEWVRHYAICLKDGDEEVIVDFTARQFNATAEVPLIMEREAWLEWLRIQVDILNTEDATS